jgi:dTDP-4-amino-4,6-dideoxygalactose transaminase
MDLIYNKRNTLVDQYKTHLTSEFCGTFKLRENTSINNSYYPVVFKDIKTRIKVEKALNRKDIVPRRYFYPSLNKLPYVNQQKMPIAESLADRILCLPLYHSLTDKEQMQVINIIKKTLA